MSNEASSSNTKEMQNVKEEKCVIGSMAVSIAESAADSNAAPIAEAASGSSADVVGDFIREKRSKIVVSVNKKDTVINAESDLSLDDEQLFTRAHFNSSTPVHIDQSSMATGIDKSSTLAVIESMATEVDQSSSLTVIESTPTITNALIMNEAESCTAASNQVFDCRICLTVAQNPVITSCGHLYCWSCLHQYVQMRTNQQYCPVCNTPMSIDTLIPLYGCSNNTCEADRDAELPPRPTATPQQSMSLVPTNYFRYPGYASRVQQTNHRGFEFIPADFFIQRPFHLAHQHEVPRELEAIKIGLVTCITIILIILSFVN